MNISAVSLKNISAVRDEVEILKNISFEFPSGETTVIMGPSGCGKSVLLKIAAGIIPPEKGNVQILQRDVKKIPDRELTRLRRDHGFIFQDAALWANRTVYQNLSLPLEFHNRGISRKILEKRILETLKMVGYRDSIHLRPSQLSSGERKMVAFGRAIIGNPQIVFMDEPTMSVDYEVADKLMKIILRLKEENRTLIISTNDPQLASVSADHLVILKAGAVLESGPFKQVIRSSNREVAVILSDVLSQTTTYSGDILDLLGSEE